jgi:hypothetical protein
MVPAELVSAAVPVHAHGVAKLDQLREQLIATHPVGIGIQTNLLLRSHSGPQAL